MALPKKEIDLLEFLFSNRDRYTPLSNLETVFVMSDKTIRKMIENINCFLEQFHAQVILKRGHGYKLIVENQMNFLHLINYLYESELSNSVEIMALNKLIESKDYITIDELCKMFYVSKSYLNKVIINIKEKLRFYDLSIESRPHYGMKVEGSEIGKRLVIFSFIPERMYIEKSLKDIVSNLLLKEINKHDILTSDIMLKDLTYQICIMIQRLRNDFTVKLHNHDFQINDITYNIAVSITDQLEDLLSLHFSTSEIMYLYTQIIGLINHPGNEEFQIDINIKNKMVFDQFLEKIEKLYDIYLGNDENFRENLSRHLKPLVHRLINGTHIKNPFLNDIKQQLPFAFNIAVILADQISLVYEKKLTDDEIAYLSMHISLALERNSRENIKLLYNRIAIVCSTGQGTSKLLEFKVRNYFPEAAVKTFQLYEKKEVQQFQPDIIFSTVPYQFYNIPVEIISPFFNDDDKEKLEKLQEKQKIQQILDKYFSKDLFSTKLKPKSRKEAITEVCSLVGQTGIVPENFLDLCLKREELASTSFGNLIALVHPLELCSKITKVGVGILNEPIVWEGLPVRIVFVIAQAKSNEARDLLLFLQKVVHEKQLIIELCEVKDFEDFSNKIITYFS